MNEGRLAVTTRDGGLAILRASDGAELARAESGHLGGLIDLTYDPTHSRLVAYEETDEGQGAEVAEYPVRFDATPVTLGPRQRLAWVDGVARVFALPEGLLEVEENIGQRWDLSAGGSKPTPGIACPRPASLVVDRSGGGIRFIAASAPFPTDGRAQRLEVGLSDSGLALSSVTDLPLAPESARLVKLAAGAEILVGIVNQKLSIALLGQRTAELGGPLGLAAETVEQALLIDSARGRIAILTTGPDRVIVADVRTSEESLSFGAATHIELIGDVRREAQFFSREMTSIGERIFVATDLGIEAIDLAEKDGGLALLHVPFGEAAEGRLNPYRGPVVSLVGPDERPDGKAPR